MKTTRRLILILLFSLFLGACGGAPAPQPTPQPTQPAAPTQLAAPPTQPAVEEYPVPEANSYPAPELQAAQPQGGTSLYPEYKSGDQVEWYQALSLLLNGEVTGVTQGHDLKVTLALKDGRTLVTVEPAIDDVVKAIQSCGDPCKTIAVATE